MILYLADKVLIVEGISDKRRVIKVLKEEMDIICTNGTISLVKLDELIETLDDKDVYILVDADESGEKLRKQLKQGMPSATHLYIDKMFRQVENAPLNHLATVLQVAKLAVRDEFIE